MDVGLAVEAYVTAMVESVTGMKVLLLDEETVQIVSLVYSQVRVCPRCRATDRGMAALIAMFACVCGGGRGRLLA